MRWKHGVIQYNDLNHELNVKNWLVKNVVVFSMAMMLLPLGTLTTGKRFPLKKKRRNKLCTS